MRLKFFLCVFLSLNPVKSQAQLLTEEAVSSIERLANVICIGLENEGSSSNVTLNADAAAEAKVILKLLGGAEGSIDVEAFVAKYQNVPREELSRVLSSAQDCRLEVFRTAREEVAAARSASSPQQDKLVWTFPHVIRDGLALGVINAKPKGGSGVNVNFRLRNTSSEELYVKFYDMSYTDETGNVCQKGSLSTWMEGIAWRSDDEPNLLQINDSLQFSAVNIRCDGSGFGSSGDIIVSVLAGKEASDLQEIRFEISGIDMVTN